MASPIVVVSTAKTPSNETRRCIESVRNQTVKVRHELRYGPKAALENLYEMVHAEKPDTIIVWLDGDDYLADNNALEVVRDAYEDERVWMTYGQFRWESNGEGFARQARLEELLHPRSSQWIFTHLKTFMAGLFQKIRQEDLRWLDKTQPMSGMALTLEATWPGTVFNAWLEPTDMPVMFPMIEMAGPDHVKFISDVLCIYTGKGGDKNHEDYVRAQQLYKPLTERPW